METVWNTLATLIERGGWVMYPLMVLSVISTTLILERIWFWRRMHKTMPEKRVSQFATHLRSSDTAALEKLLKGDHSFATQLLQRMSKQPSAEAAESVAIEIIEQLRRRIERYMTLLSTIITAAPLIGILGTVIGIIQSFELLGESNMVTDPREVSAGIAQALLTTAAGLIVALITLFPYMAFRGFIDRTLGQFEVLISARTTGFRKADKQTTTKEV